MTDDLMNLVDEATVYRLLADALYAKSKELSGRAAEIMGRGTLNPRLPDGTEIAQWSVPADSRMVDVDEVALLPFVRQHYPTEVMEAVRPAFLEKVREMTRQAEKPCGPGGEMDIPGVTFWLKPGAPKFTAKPAGRERARAAVESVLDDALGSFARVEIEAAQ